MQALRHWVAGSAACRLGGRRGLNTLDDKSSEINRILLLGVPRTATPADIRRAISRSDVFGVSDIALDYNYFKPTERAILTLVSPTYLQHNLAVLQNLTISGLPVTSQEYVPENSPRQGNKRMRGHEGRTQAAGRGALSGDGPGAGVPNNEMNVVISGLPGKFTPKDLGELLKDFDITLSGRGLPQIQKIPIPADGFTITSKFLVTLNSVPEAHRVVRAMHATYRGNDFLVSAKIIY